MKYDDIKHCITFGFTVSIGMFIFTCGMAWMAMRTLALTESERLLGVLIISGLALIISVFVGGVASAIRYVKESQTEVGWLKEVLLTFAGCVVASFVWGGMSSGSESHRTDVTLFGLFLSLFIAVLVGVYAFNKRSNGDSPEAAGETGESLLEQQELLDDCGSDKQTVARSIREELKKLPKIRSEGADRPSSRIGRNS